MLLNKNNTMKYNIVIRALAYSLLLLGCKKFDDDPFYSLSGAKGRLQAATPDETWQIENISIDGVNVNELYQDSLSPNNLHELHFYFNKNVHLDDGEDPYAWIKTSNSPTSNNDDLITNANYFLNSKEERISFKIRQVKDSIRTKILLTNLLSFGSNHIKKLYRKEFIITKTIKNKFYEITFKK